MNDDLKENCKEAVVTYPGISLERMRKAAR
jgi:hypothetical protein